VLGSRVNHPPRKKSLTKVDEIDWPTGFEGRAEIRAKAVGTQSERLVEDRRARFLMLAKPGAFAKGAGAAGRAGVIMVDEAQIKVRLGEIRTEHRDLDAAIAALWGNVVPDQLQIARLKKRKLRLRDEIAAFEDQLIPDIIA
jgi:hypothetical protein